MTYWLAWKKAKETIFIFGIHRKNCAEYLSKLIQNFGFSNPDISPLERSWTDIKFFDGTRPAYKVTSQDSSYYFRIQFGYFTRIDICETQNEKDETKFEINETQVKNFKETCWKTFDELSGNIIIAPYIIGLLSLLVFAIILILINTIGFFSYFVTFYLFFGVFPQLFLNYFLLIPYRINISEFLPDLD
ncbi:MAG: hypothetical protein KAH01_03160 [Caldisericia bacterium]|nr:hypothetical protein [Caldisericia bacterium]